MSEASPATPSLEQVPEGASPDDRGAAARELRPRRPAWPGPARRVRLTVPSAADRRVRPPRRRRVVPAVLVAGFLLVMGVLVAIDVIAVNTSAPRSIIFPYEQIADLLRTNHWSNVPILAVSAFVAALGALLIAVALTPARKGRTAVATGDSEVSATVSHRSLRRACAAAAVAVPGIAKVRVKAGRRTVKVRADSRLRDPSGLSERVATSVGERLAGMGPARRMVVRVRVRKKSQ